MTYRTGVTLESRKALRKWMENKTIVRRGAEEAVKKPASKITKLT